MAKPNNGWKPLVKADTLKRPPGWLEGVREEAERQGIPAEKLLAQLEQYDAETEYWINDIFQVQKLPLRDKDGNIAAYHLNIRRRDGKPIFRDWRHFQKIKNELVGEECEGLEIYPAESRLTDSSNKYHMYVFADPTYRIPFGMQERDVTEQGKTDGPKGFRQRKIV